MSCFGMTIVSPRINQAVKDIVHAQSISRTDAIIGLVLLQMDTTIVVWLEIN